MIPYLGIIYTKIGDHVPKKDTRFLDEWNNQR